MMNSIPPGSTPRYRMTHMFFSHTQKISAMEKKVAIAHRIMPRVNFTNTMIIKRAMPEYMPIRSRVSECPKAMNQNAKRGKKEMSILPVCLRLFRVALSIVFSSHIQGHFTARSLAPGCLEPKTDPSDLSAQRS